MDEQPGQQPQYSPDGKWWWDGQQWVAVGRAPTPPAPPGRRKMSTGRKVLLGFVGGAVLLFMGVCTLAVASNPQTQQGANAGAKAAAGTAAPTHAASTPSSPAPAAKAGQPSPTCTPTDDTDVLVRYVVPRLAPSASRLGGTDAFCRSTFDYIAKTSPTGSGYCTTAAYARDNPGYDPEANPAPPLKKVVVAVGGAC